MRENAATVRDTYRSGNCPMVVAARYGYSVPPSEACICTKQNRSIWVRLSPIVLRAPHGAICAILVLATDVSRDKLTEQLVPRGQARSPVRRRWPRRAANV
jgi:hypothetical protein